MQAECRRLTFELSGARRRGGRADIEVWDSGPGIPEHHLQQIFEEFQRFEQPSPWGERGLGLGLSICQRVSRVLDHPLGVRSWPGRGSVAPPSPMITIVSSTVPW